MIPNFRVWDKRRRFMDEVVIIDWQWPEQEAWVNDEPSDDLIVMQSTGLHDSTKFEDLSIEEQEEWLESGNTAEEWQGREIFEGDILKSQDGTDGLIEVIIVERDYFYTGFKPMNDDYSGFNQRMCEVIGNIYENADLLEEQ